MRCPVCSEHSSSTWQPLHRNTDVHGLPSGGPQLTLFLKLDETVDREWGFPKVSLQWTACQNEACGAVLVKATETRPRRTIPGGIVSPAGESPPRPAAFAPAHWRDVVRYDGLIYPSATRRPVSALVPDRYAKDFQEAATIVGLSPKASAALSRKVLADVLTEVCGLDDRNLYDKLNKFVANDKYPSALRENVGHLRVIGNYAVHTEKNATTAEIIEVEPDEAEWALDVLDRLFDHLFVLPAKDREVRSRIDAKRARQT